MIRQVDSREWAQVTYHVYSKWIPLIGDVDHWNTVCAMFTKDSRLLSGGSSELQVMMVGTHTEGSEEAICFSYRVSHTIVTHGAQGGIKDILEQVWGIIAAVTHSDIEGETISLTILDVVSTRNVVEKALDT